MTEQQKKTDKIIEISDQFTPLLIYSACSIFMVIFFWIQFKYPFITISRVYIYFSLIIGFISVSFGIYMITYNYYYNSNLIQKNDYTDVLIDPSANEFRGINTMEFYTKYHHYVYQNEREFSSITNHIIKKKLVYFINIFFLVILNYIFLYNCIIEGFTSLKILELIGLISFSSILISIMIIELHELYKKKIFRIQLNSNHFTSLMKKNGINLRYRPKTKIQAEIVEFLELANFLQKYHQNYKKKFSYSISNFIIYLSFGLFVHFFTDSEYFFKDIGFGLCFYSFIYLGICYAKFVKSKEIIIYTQEILKEFVFRF